MIRLACVVVAAVSLSACATFAPISTSPAASAASFDGEAPVEAPAFHHAASSTVGTWRVGDRRSFSPPLRRQPELRVTVVTAADRLRRRALRRVLRRA
jgi:hypothetical protein